MGKYLTLGSCTVWTLATIASSQAQTYNEVLLARVIMGGSCAFAIPAAYTLIAEKVSKDKLALSNSIFGSGVYLGGALASLSLLLDESLGWRGTLGVIGGFGIVSIAVAGLLIPDDGDRNTNNEPTKMVGPSDISIQQLQNIAKEEQNSLVQNAKQIISIPRVKYIYIASCLRFCSGLLIAIWLPSYYKEAFPGDIPEYAVVNALIKGVIGFISAILGGYIADGLSKYYKSAEEDGTGAIFHDYFDDQTIRLLLPIVGSVFAIPAFYLTTHTNASFEVAMFWLAVEYIVAECWFGPTTAVLQSTVGSSKTGTAQGLFVLTGALGNLAPSLLGLIYGNTLAQSSPSSSSEVLASLLTWGVCLGYFLSSIFFALGVSASGVIPEGTTSKEQ